MSSSTDHTPTKAQKNVATSEGRHVWSLCFIFPFLSWLFERWRECGRLTSSWLHETLSDLKKEQAVTSWSSLWLHLLPLKLTWWDLSVLMLRQMLLFCENVIDWLKRNHYDIIFQFSTMVKWYDIRAFDTSWKFLQECAEQVFLTFRMMLMRGSVTCGGLELMPKLGICKDALFHYLNNMWKTLC